jgi:hypothetical protein
MNDEKSRKYARLVVANFIDVDTWNKAAWCATAFVGDLDESEPPALGIIFGNEQAGRRIFNDWLDRFGQEDELELLRVSIIEGDIPGKPPGYTVFIGTDRENYFNFLASQQFEWSGTAVLAANRFHRMTPRPDSPYLPAFKKSYQLHKEYLLFPAFGSPSNPRPEESLGIKKKLIHFLQADAIGKDDLESAILEAEA